MMIRNSPNTLICFFLLINKAIHSYTKQVVELDQMLRRMVFESLGVEKYYDGHIESGNYRFRVQKYFVILMKLREDLTGLATATVGLTMEAAQHLEEEEEEGRSREEEYGDVGQREEEEDERSREKDNGDDGQRRTGVGR
ncbi:hypothetical protein IFM89_022028 [Coptis chinensis]|uniref:Uncharacterized protein n=1 Tax=Coptis chinensis TaxID=261450 RepID=A0A835LW15_9MAGN|nr:hypothetical protein IFM89_022028 [Coptis chinensis]